MPKMKTKKSAAKRFKLTAKGKVKRNKAFGSHILTKKSRERKRKYRRSQVVRSTDMKQVRQMLPYG